MIHLWLRELAGWLLIAIGLFLFYITIAFLSAPAPGILEAPVFSVIGIVVFRGGIHLLKVATAARVCLHTQAEMSKQQQADKSKKKSATPWDW